MKYIRFLIIPVLLIPFFAHAQDLSAQDSNASAQQPPASETFEARVVEIINQREKVREDGSKFVQQDLRLRGLTGAWKNHEVVSHGISDLDVIDAAVYKQGDRVIVNYEKRPDGTPVFTPTDFVRRGYVYILVALFVASILAIGRWKGLRALIGLVITFGVIMEFIIPRMLAGANPIVISVVGSIAIILLSTYLTEGWHRNAHISVASISLALLAALGMSIVFTKLTRLTGFSQEETLYLLSLGKGTINFQGLLLAGILIGTLGVLDDAVLSQIEAVAQIREANPLMSHARIFKMAFKVGNSHLGAIVNTLFLTYAGASLPLLLLFKLHEGPAVQYAQVLNSEVIVTEIIRTLVGSIAIALSLPIATVLAVYLTPHSKRVVQA